MAYLSGLRRGDVIHSINGVDWRHYSDADMHNNLSSVLSLDLTYSRPYMMPLSNPHSNISSNIRASEVINLVDSDQDSVDFDDDSDMVDCLMDISNRTIDVDLYNRARHHLQPQNLSSNVGRSIMSNGQLIIDLVSDDEETDLPLPPSSSSTHLPRPPLNPLKRLCNDAIDAIPTNPPVVPEKIAAFKKRKIIVKGIEIKLEFEPKSFGAADQIGEVVEVRGCGDAGKLNNPTCNLYALSHLLYWLYRGLL